MSELYKRLVLGMFSGMVGLLMFSCNENSTSEPFGIKASLIRGSGDGVCGLTGNWPQTDVIIDRTTERKAIFEVEIVFFIQNIPFLTKFIVLKNISKVIFGMTFLEQYEAVIRTARQTIELSFDSKFNPDLDFEVIDKNRIFHKNHLFENLQKIQK